jgi:hypothetical protein
MAGVYSVTSSRVPYSAFVTSHQVYHDLVSVVKILLKAFFVRNGNAAKTKEGRGKCCKNKRRQKEML